MTCDRSTALTELRNALMAKVAECGCGALPSNLTTLCGDGQGLITELYNAAQQMVSDGCVFTHLVAPAAPSGCIGNAYISELKAYFKSLQCAESDCTIELPIVNETRPLIFEGSGGNIIYNDAAGIYYGKDGHGLTGNPNAYKPYWFSDRSVHKAGMWYLATSGGAYRVRMRKLDGTFEEFTGLNEPASRPSTTSYSSVHESRIALVVVAVDAAGGVQFSSLPYSMSGTGVHGPLLIPQTLLTRSYAFGIYVVFFPAWNTYHQHRHDIAIIETIGTPKVHLLGCNELCDSSLNGVAAGECVHDAYGQLSGIAWNPPGDSCVGWYKVYRKRCGNVDADCCSDITESHLRATTNPETLSWTIDTTNNGLHAFRVNACGYLKIKNDVPPATWYNRSNFAPPPSAALVTGTMAGAGDESDWCRDGVVWCCLINCRTPDPLLTVPADATSISGFDNMEITKQIRVKNGVRFVISVQGGSSGYIGSPGVTQAEYGFDVDTINYRSIFVVVGTEDHGTVCFDVVAYNSCGKSISKSFCHVFESYPEPFSYYTLPTYYIPGGSGGGGSTETGGGSGGGNSSWELVGPNGTMLRGAAVGGGRDWTLIGGGVSIVGTGGTYTLRVVYPGGSWSRDYTIGAGESWTLPRQISF